ncbi:hypothetical protein CXB51_015680 [Gossypium anomalum]|uniref:Cytochrome P450 n=1 Tax=Gossypium anomalum TaxID=47600 RepID=A0A8J5Z6R5_9ROSI|nr:hypothetical protein CXB51_015680 [Gossypium anomalum]
MLIQSTKPLVSLLLITYINWKCYYFIVDLLMGLVLAAEDTTSIILTWVLSLLLNNHDKLSKVQQELDVYIGKDRLFVTESDTKNLVYLQSIIKETLRLYPPAPLSVIHEAIEDCIVNGYHLTLANVLHWFEFETPSGIAVDMREGLGITSSKATPLEVHITPRLPFFSQQLQLLQSLLFHYCFFSPSYGSQEETQTRRKQHQKLSHDWFCIIWTLLASNAQISTIELLSNHRLNLLKHVKTSLQQLYQLWNKTKSSNRDKVLVEMKRWFRDVTLNVILRIVVGKRMLNSYEGVETVKWKKSLDDLFGLNALPYLRCLDIGGDLKLMKKVAKDLDQVAEEWLREHKEKRAENEANSEEDFMGVLLYILSDTEEHAADTINKATSLNLILVAEDNSSITMTWALSLLLNNETLHIYPAALHSVIHEAIEDCSVSRYHVSADTNVKGHDFELIPFSSGRRMCPRVSIETLSGEAVDMREAPGLTSPKVTPLEVKITPLEFEGVLLWIWGYPYKYPEFQKKKRVASYKMYRVEGKVKGSLRMRFRWPNDTFTQAVYGWWDVTRMQ